MKLKTQTRRQAPSQTKKPKAPASTSFSDHIGELRRRIFAVAVIFLGASGLAYNYHDFLVKLIMQPLGGQKLIYLTPAGGFNFIFQVSMYAGILAAAPMMIYQLYGFIRPALPARAQRSASKVVASAFLLMLCGVAFGYFVAVPSALHFLSDFAGSDITPNLTADSYLSFFLAYIAGLGVLFELPLLLLFLHWIHPMTPGSLLKTERFVILFAFVVAAIITPTPDVFNQSMIAIPLILIYQFGVFAVWIAIRREHRKHKQNPAVSVPVAPRAMVPTQDAMSSRATTAPVATSPTLPQSVAQPVRRRTIDGFAPGPRLVVPASRQPTVHIPPQRPLRPAATPGRRVSLDGFSMV